MAGLLMKYQNGVGGIVLASSSINSDKSELKMAGWLILHQNGQFLHDHQKTN